MKEDITKLSDEQLQQRISETKSRIALHAKNHNLIDHLWALVRSVSRLLDDKYTEGDAAVRNELWTKMHRTCDNAREYLENIKTGEAPAPPPQSEGELWMNIVTEVACYYNGTEDKHLRFADVDVYAPEIIKKLSKDHVISLRSDKPELFTKEQVTQLIREAFIEGFRNNGVPRGEWSDNLEGNEEQLKDFINSKLQPGVKG